MHRRSAPRRLAKWILDALPFKRSLFQVLRAFPIPERIYRHLHFKGVITVKVPGSGSFRIMHHGYLIENELFWKGLQGWEKVSTELWIRLCRRSSVILDIGANTGVFALIARTVRPEARIVAVEPVARIFRKLEANIALNGGGVLALNAAVSDHTGTATLFDLPGSEHVLSVSLDPAWNSTHPDLRPVEVPCTTVRDILDRMGANTVDLLKIDVETHEPAVLRGFQEIIRRDRPTLLIELLTDEVAAQVAELIAGTDYVHFNIDDAVWPPRRVETLTRSDHFNFLICRPEVATSIGLDPNAG